MIDANANVSSRAGKDDFTRINVVGTLLECQKEDGTIPDGIVPQVARAYDVKPRTVHGWLKTWRDEGRMTDKRDKDNHRPYKFGQADLEAIYGKAEEEPFWTWKQLGDWFTNEYSEDQKSICNWTLRKACREHGIWKRRAGVTRSWTPLHIANRLNYANERFDWPVASFHSDIYTDEKGVCGNGIIRQYVNRPDNTAHLEKYRVQGSPRTVRVNFYAWISSQGLGNLVFFPGNGNSASIIDAIDIALPEMAEMCVGVAGQKTIYHDRAPIYTSGAVREHLDECETARQDFSFELLPALSPDLNPIENVFGALEKRLQPKLSRFFVQNGRAVNRDELIQLTRDSWEELRGNQNLIPNLYNSLPTRIAQLIENDGRSTTY